MNVKCDEVKNLSGNSNNQLYHILRTDSFAFCLICLEYINNTSIDVGKHLNCENHQESIRRLFQACNPNVVIDGDERFMDFVLKSVFDISVLLGEETCYICDRGGSWSCLMCEQTITDCKNPDTMVQDQIVYHVLSETHVNKTKGVCFLYRLNSDQDFVLLNKSIVYCSACKEIVQCKDVDLLNAAVVHLKSKKHQQITKSSCIYSQDNCLIKKENDFDLHNFKDEEEYRQSVSKTDRVDEITDKPCFNKGDLFKNGREKPDHNLELSQETGQYFDEIQFCKDYTCTCLLCQREIKCLEKGVVVSINIHFCKGHQKVYIDPSTSLKSIMDSVIFQSKPNEIGLISKSLSIEKHLKKKMKRNSLLCNNTKYIFRAKSCYFCIACMALMPHSEDFQTVMEHFQSHFTSFKHQKCVKEKMMINHSFNLDSKDKKIKSLLIKRNTHIKRVQKRKEKSKMQRQRKKLCLFSSGKVKIENHQGVKTEVN